jgi:hypothetical protein
MAVPAGTFQTYQAVGNREDLSDIITNISPTETQFFSKIAECNGGASGVKHEWQTDALGATGANKHIEGDDTEFTALTPTVRLYNQCQIQKKSVVISGTQNTPKLKKAGRTSELDYQTAKKAIELANDVEYAFLREVRVDGDAGTARSMRGALNWCISNVSKEATAVLNADGTITPGIARAITQAILDDTLQNIWTAGGKPDTIYTPASQKRKISALATAALTNYRVAVEANKLDTTIDVYVSEFGVNAIKPHRVLPAGTIFICDHKHFKKATLRNTFREKLAKVGDNEKWHILVEHTLESCAEKASGRIVDLS